MVIGIKAVFIAKLMKLAVLVVLLAACSPEMDEAESLSKAREYYQNRDLMAASIELKNILQANPRSAEARFLLGNIYLRIGDATFAEKDLRRALENGWDEAATQLLLAEVLSRKNEYQAILDDISIKDSYPDNIRAEFLGLLASAEQALGKWDDAEGTIITAENIHQDALWVLRSRIQLQLYNGDTAAAAATVERAIELYPANQDLWLLKAALTREKGDLLATEANLKKVLDLEPLRIVSAWGRKARIEQCRVRLLQDQPEKALEALRPALKMFPSDPELNYLRSAIAFEQGEYDIARNHLLDVFRVESDHYASLSLYGNLSYIEKDYQQAAYYLEKATTLRPGNLADQALLGKTYLVLGRYNEAEQRLDFTASRAAENAELLALQGISAIRRGDEAGLHKLEKAVDVAPENAAIRNELAMAYMTMGDMNKAIGLLESALEKGGEPHEQAQTESILVRAYLQSGEFNKAIDLSRELASQTPDSPLPYHLEGIAHEGKQDYTAARNSYRKALSVKPDYVLSILGEAGLDVTAGEVEQARKRYETVLEIQPDHSGAMAALAFFTARDGKIHETINLLEKAKMADSQAIDPRVIRSLFKLQEGQAAEALKLAEDARAAAPDDPRVLLALGIAQLANGKADARKTLLRLTEMQPRLAEGHFFLAQARAAAGDVAGNRASLKKVLDLAPDLVQARLALGKLELQTGNADAAMQLAQQLKSSDTGKAGGYLLEGDVLMGRKQASSAIKAYQAAYKLTPGSSEAVIRINRAYRLAGNNEAGVQTLEDWLNENPDNLTVRIVLAMSYLADGKQDAAMGEYEKIVDKQPENAAALNGLAWLYHEKGKPGALEMARKASKLAPDDPAIEDTYGWILVQAGGAASGLAALEDAAAKLPNNREVQYHLAYALVETGQAGKARGILDEILRDGKPFGDRDKAEALSGKLK